eukprot:2320691-Amphidinium_carterae.1
MVCSGSQMMCPTKVGKARDHQDQHQSDYHAMRLVDAHNQPHRGLAQPGTASVSSRWGQQRTPVDGADTRCGAPK